MIIWVFVAIIWISAGVYAAGTYFAYMQGEFPTLAEKDKSIDLCSSIFIGTVGIISAFVMFFCSGFNKHGWRLK